MSDFELGKKDGRRSQSLFWWSLTSFGNIVGVIIAYFVFLPSQHEFPEKSDAYFAGYLNGVRMKRIWAWLFGLVFWYIAVLGIALLWLTGAFKGYI